ncbi:amidohydrolase family protein [Neobacillus terrae]|uniref:amidohydrolase family protein n=1 Tax=Neobacillus terrae TaxID=3034837 RepID=UPI00140AAF72|nr:amidohydrolase family protein [Neobacillus terrae]NHM30807.1 amidohydrolase family protein [Neobacillus terrae]
MSDSQHVLLKDINLVDVVSGFVFPASILIKDGFISKIFNNDEQYLSETGIRMIDGNGKWVIPGLIDMHVHIKDGFAPLFVASGVTTVRNTGGNVLELKKLREASGDAATPRVFSADRVIDGHPGLWGETSPWNFNTDDPNAAREEVIRQVKAGADLIKVYGWLSKEVMAAVVLEAKKHQKEVSCDLIHSTKVNAVEAGEIGVKWNEHASGIIQAMYPQWNMEADEQTWKEVNWSEPDLYKIKEVCIQLIQYGVIICPTMALFDQMNRLNDCWKPVNIVLSKTFENKGLIRQWEHLSQYVDALKQQGIQTEINKAIAKTYFDLGGTVVAGTDSPAGIWSFPGMLLHRELELFVEAGFSELDAIRAPTSVAAKSLNRLELGIIQEGAIADLVILNSNPLENIRNTKDIDLVIKGGKVYSQSEILENVPSEEENKRNLEDFMKIFNETKDPIKY